MALKTFAAIDVGSYELSMKIFEFTRKKTIRQIDHIRRSIDLGTETFSKGVLSFDKVDELCYLLKEYKKIMDSYRVEGYMAYGTSALREVKNSAILIDQIKQRTGIEIDVITNSEQRFLDYKSVALMGERFNHIIADATVILDIGGASIQMSLFEKSTLIATQNMKLGVLRIIDRMNTVGASLQQYEHLVSELCESQLNTYKKLYLKDINVKNIIIIDDHISFLINRNIMARGIDEMVKSTELYKTLEECRKLSRGEFIQRAALSEDSIPMVVASIVLLSKVIQITGADTIWAPGVTLCDGIGYEYAERKGYIISTHDFEEDIRACAIQIGRRYSGSRKRAETLERIALRIFDAIKDMHGLDSRDRLLLQLATYLHDCGKYVSMSNLAECSYGIIRNTEIIGISHRERIILANVVRYNQLEFDYFDDFRDHEHIESSDHMRIAKLTAILRLANGLDRSHKMKFRDIEVKIKQNELLLQIETDQDITLEKGLFGNRAQFFEEVYNLIPIIKQKRSF